MTSSTSNQHVDGHASAYDDASKSVLTLKLSDALFPDSGALYPIMEDASGECQCLTPPDTKDVIGICGDHINVFLSSSIAEGDMWSHLDQVMSEGELLFSQLESQWLYLDKPFNKYVGLKQATLDELPNCVEICLDDAREIRIYVDGGFNPENLGCSWSFVVILICQDGKPCVHASSGGRLMFESTSCFFLGESVESSYSAEVYAQILAHIYVLQYLSDHRHIPISIYFDNISAADAIRGRSGPGCEPDLVRFAVLCGLFASDFEISYQHVRAHVGDPWNEFADSLCTFYLDMRQRPALWNCPIGPMNHYKYSCLNLFYSVGLDSIARSLCIPQSVYEKYDFKFQKGCNPELIAAHLDQVPLDKCCTIVPEKIYGMQYNIQSFRCLSKRTYFISLMCRYKYAFACLQETRDPKNQIRFLNGIVICSSAGNAGHLGCEVLINTEVAWYSKDCKSARISRDSVTIVHAEPRVLIVCITDSNIVLYVVSAHAPYVGCEESYSKWWSHFRKKI